MRSALMTALVALSFVGCAPPASQSAPPVVEEKPAPSASTVQDWNSVIIKLERGPCMGGCPIYTVEIHGDGSVIFDGVNFVKATGRQTAQVTPEQVRALAEQFEAAGFAALADEYRGDITDGAAYRTTFAHDGQSKTVVNYMGYLADMPKSVGELEQAIDALAGTKTWIEG